MLRFRVVNTWNNTIQSHHHTDKSAQKAARSHYNANKKMYGDVYDVWEVFEMKQYINVEIGIYNTEISLACVHHNGDISLSVPFIQWDKSGNTGSLKKQTIRFSEPEDIKAIRKCFTAGKTHVDSCDLWEVIEY